MWSRSPNRNAVDAESILSTVSNKKTRCNIILVVLGWQCTALILALINVFSELLTEHNWRTPTLMNCPMYLLLFIFTIIKPYIMSSKPQSTIEPVLVLSSGHIQTTNSNNETPNGTNGFYTHSKLLNGSLTSSYNSTENIECETENSLKNSSFFCSKNVSNIPLIYYLFGSIADVEGNVFLLTAYEYTTITSVSLLDCFAIPIVMILSIFIFHRKYFINHYIGVIISLCGMCLLVYTDYTANNSSNHGSSPIFGDILVLIGSLFYAISNTFQEYVVKYYNGIWEFLRMIGLFGFIITAIQGGIFEYHALFYQNEYNLITGLYLCGYVLSLSLYYIIIPIMFKFSSAVVFNISLLSADFWAVLAGIFLFSIHLHYLYFIAFAIIIGGVIWYNIANHFHKRLDN